MMDGKVSYDMGTKRRTWVLTTLNDMEVPMPEYSG
jgi:hypothetical protein